MIEHVIKQFLDSHLSVPSFLEQKGKMPERFVLFEKTGSREKNHLFSATIAFQSYAESLYQAALLNEEVKVVLKKLIELDEVSRVKLTSDYNYTDITTKKYRYQAVVDITHY